MKFVSCSPKGNSIHTEQCSWSKRGHGTLELKCYVPEDFTVDSQEGE